MGSNLGKNNTYLKVAREAIEIANNIGNPIIREDYYSDTILGKSYEYSGLRIDYYNKNNDCIVYIHINDRVVLSYDHNNDNLFYTEGNWAQLIHVIYGKLEAIISDNKSKEREFLNKMNELKALEPYFKDCVVYDKQKGFLDLLNNKLNQYDIWIFKSEYRNTFVNKVTGETEESAVPTIRYFIKHNDKTVASFMGNAFNVLPSFNNSARELVIGSWITNFKFSVIRAKNEQDQISNQVNDKSAMEIIKKFRKDYR